ncbi:conserved Plasmodium protein [uncultured Mediterranean phage uvMED]|nr:conserved Plasmodium protein [uncultured Mediterranean phage uvMED]
MADGFGLAMAELEFAGAKFRGGKIFVILTALTTLGGGLWGGFEFYKDYLDMKDQIQNYTAPDLSGFDKRLDLIQQETEMITQEMSMIIQEVQLVSDVANELKNDLRQDVRRIEKIVNDVEQQVKEDSRENARDLKEAITNIKDDMKALEEKTDKQIKKALDNPLSKM